MRSGIFWVPKIAFFGIFGYPKLYFWLKKNKIWNHFWNQWPKLISKLALDLNYDHFYGFWSFLVLFLKGHKRFRYYESGSCRYCIILIGNDDHRALMCWVCWSSPVRPLSPGSRSRGAGCPSPGAGRPLGLAAPSPPPPRLPTKALRICRV